MILLGGASRTGKGIISQRLLDELKIPFISTDPLKMALSRAVPGYRLNRAGSSIAVAEQLWPFLSALIKNMAETGLEYIVEGELLPHHVAQIENELSCKMCGCFVGYSDTDPSQKVRQIKTHSGHPNDWTASLNDNELHNLVTSGIHYSQYLKEECHARNIKYVDFSNHFEESVAEVIAYLRRCHGQ